MIDLDRYTMRLMSVGPRGFSDSEIQGMIDRIRELEAERDAALAEIELRQASLMAAVDRVVELEAEREDTRAVAREVLELLRNPPPPTEKLKRLMRGKKP